MRLESDRVLKMIEKRKNCTIGMESQYAQGYRDALRHLEDAVRLEIALAELMEEQGND